MPLQPGTAHRFLGHNVAQLLHSGKPESSAIAASLGNARRHPGGFAKGGEVWPDIGPALVAPSLAQVIKALPAQALTGTQNTTSQIQKPQKELTYGVQKPETQEAPPTNAPLYGGYAKGGMALAGGGIPSTPWFARREETDGGKQHSGGLFNAPSAGRTDVLNRSVPAGAYVLPADVVSGLGEGNTMAGSNILDAMMHTMPYGIKGGKGSGGGHGIPRPPAVFKQSKTSFSKGGSSQEQKGNVPVVVAGGEFLVPPHVVKAIGGGDMKHGHMVLDHFVVHIRKKTAKTLNKLPGPKK